MSTWYETSWPVLFSCVKPDYAWVCFCICVDLKNPWPLTTGITEAKSSADPSKDLEMKPAAAVKSDPAAADDNSDDDNDVDSTLYQGRHCKLKVGNIKDDETKDDDDDNDSCSDLYPGYFTSSSLVMNNWSDVMWFIVVVLFLVFIHHRWMFSVASICLFACEHDNFWTIKHRMIKLRVYVHCTKFLYKNLTPDFEFWGHRPCSMSPHPKMPRFSDWVTQDMGMSDSMSVSK